ncbi:MAG TPA: L-aspartate oxidase [Gammaproteobacteria bacterium]|nr:L-aspartate oxidase [Gammaproteobacteria bacterium]
MMNTISQRGEREFFDALVIGSGVAGLIFCLELTKLRPKTRIALISKTSFNESNSYYAQGGIATVFSQEDSIDQHIADTLAAGDGLGNQEAIANIIGKGQQFIQDLQDYGVGFDKNAFGQSDLAQEGGHSQRRIFHCGDHTGRSLIETLTTRVRHQTNIVIFESHVAVNLLLENTKHQPGDYGEIVGAYVLEVTRGLIHTFFAPVVVLATGGAGKTYRYTSNPDVATGDGVAMAYRAGARVGNMEFYQFHPTLLHHRQCHNFLISEAVRGEGGYLRLADTGERFMTRYAPEQKELATRDIVARAIFTEIEHSAHNYVHLDITHRSRTFLEKHFPNIFHTLLSLNIDMSQDRIPVVPAAHYLCGGVLTDTRGRTDKHRLYAIGEVAFSGLHGANRLASNSLLEAGVMAQAAAKDCLTWIEQPIATRTLPRDWNSQGVTDLRRASQINAHWRGLRGEMTSYAGIVRTEAGLKDLLQLILARRQMIEEYYWKHVITRDLLELRNIILVAELIVRSALHRRESRGGHYREDFPHKSSCFEETVFQSSDGVLLNI